MSNFASGYVKYINHLEQINDAAVSDPARMIDEVEDAYHDHLENIARNITSHHQGVRVVMLSGPSSSGKTTTLIGRRCKCSNVLSRAILITN